MCGKTPKTPKVVERDPVAEQAVADAKAANDANAETAALKKRRNRSSLITGAGETASGALVPTAQAQAKPTLLGG
ncbi:hypothetical protein [Xanthomonas sacchari]|uniref:hypothetical protein n=1 Tax=Xanthomonas sacchari TaxID=56458 RepID=UPI0022588F32|nr:hypothetical protein [Xanthomonas sacchari]MCW0370259.1 hypothetical protein [Xanthomonas sacchari]